MCDSLDDDGSCFRSISHFMLASLFSKQRNLHYKNCNENRLQCVGDQCLNRTDFAIPLETKDIDELYENLYNVSNYMTKFNNVVSFSKSLVRQYLLRYFCRHCEHDVFLHLT